VFLVGAAVGLAAGCGDGSPEHLETTSAGGSAGSSSMDAAPDVKADADSAADATPDRAIDCSNVGCAPPPLCETGCQEVCGCCACAEGMPFSMNGTAYICQGGCYAPVVDAGAPWSAFSVNTGYGPCPGGQVCASGWRVTHDGAIQANKEGVLSTAQMSQTDLSDLDAILQNVDFRRAMIEGFDCPMVFDVFTTVTLEAPDVQKQSVAGCVVGGSEKVPVARAVTLVTKY